MAYLVTLPNGDCYVTTTLAEARRVEALGGKQRNPYLEKFLPPGGKVWQYRYSEDDVAKRHAEKAQRIEALKRREAALRRGIRQDLTTGDPTALAVGLILETYERPGNDGSAKSGHFGVTGWQCRHLQTRARQAVIEYVAKSGVQQRKVITDPPLVKALTARQQYCTKPTTKLIPTSAGAVNRYLDRYSVSAKDLRTFGANREMQRALEKARTAGPRLDTLKPRDVLKTLKAEFNSALAVVAGKLGHTTGVLRKQYLVKTVEPLYLETGEIIRTFA